MRKLALGILVVGGAVAGFLTWRRAMEPGRRYAELLERIRLHVDGSRAVWPEREAGVFWEDVEWFRDRDPEELGRKALASILDGDELDEVEVLISGLLRLEGVRAGSIARNAGHPLPPLDPPDDGPFQARVFRFSETILGSIVAVGQLARSPSSSLRALLLLLVSEGRDAPAHAISAATRIAEADADLDLRLYALKILSKLPGEPGGVPLLLRSAADSEPAVRLVAMAGLADRGNAQMARELVLGMMQTTDRPVNRTSVMAMLEISPSLRAGPGAGPDLSRFLMRGERRITGEGWELAERMGDVLERRAVGEFDGPASK